MESGQIIKEAREKLGWSQKALADRVGVSQVAIKKIETGETRQTKFLPKIAQVLNLDLAALDSTLHNPMPIGFSESQAPMFLEQPIATDRGSDFPVYASAEGGLGEIIRTTDPVDFVPRPTHLLHVKDAYGLLITGTSMSPEYKNGEMAIVEPRLPIEADEVYIFYSEKNGEARATIKHLRRATSDKWLVTQHNPPAGQNHDFTLPRREWGVAHRVTGKYRRRY